MPTFEIPDGPTTVDASRSAAATATYNVTNTSPDTCDGRLSVVVSAGSKSEWFSIDGDRERTFAAGETQTAVVRIRFPADAPEGEYRFRLRAIAVNDPDNDHVEGPAPAWRPSKRNPCCGCGSCSASSPRSPSSAASITF